MRNRMLPLVLLFLTQGGFSFAQVFEQNCLHGRSEQPTQRARRQVALQLGDQINMAEASAKLTSRYRPLSELRNLPSTPPGFDVRLFTDGATYTFSIRDGVDPCHYAIFSDETGLVYEGYPSTRSVGPKLLSQ